LPLHKIEKADAQILLISGSYRPNWDTRMEHLQLRNSE